MATPQGAGKVTLMTIARAVGVSPTTVSNAYNRPQKLTPALRERILEAAPQLRSPRPPPPRARLPGPRSRGAQPPARPRGQLRAAVRRGARLRVPRPGRRRVPARARGG